MKDNPTTYCPFFGVFSSYLVAKAKKNVSTPFSIHAFPHAEIPINNSECRELFKATTCMFKCVNNAVNC